MKRILLMVVVLGLSLSANAGTPGKTEAKKYKLNKITVTSQKVEENLREVPVSVSVFNDLALEDQEIKKLEDLANYVPNMYLPAMGDWGWTGPSMRGLYTDLVTSATSVGMYVDGVPTTSAAGFLALMSDVERVEVLRGPQGTLYGKNAEAGVINIITKKPGNEREGRIYAEAGEDNKREAGLSFRTPIVKDRFYVGLTGRFFEKDGYLKNTFRDTTDNDRKNYFGKLYLRLTPTERLDISLISSRYKTDDGVVSQNSVSAANHREYQSDLDGFIKNTMDSHSLKIKYAFDTFTLESITGYKETEINTFIDTDFTPMEIFHSRALMPHKTWSEEVRLSGKMGKLKWLTGLYGDKMEKTGGYTVSSIAPHTAGAFKSDFDEKTIGVFGHVDYQLTGKISILLGLRYDHDQREIKDYAMNIHEEADYSAFSPKFALKYKVSDQLTTYATVAKGYKSGGFYTFAPAGYPKNYDQETLWSYEIGAKSVWLDGRLMLNGAVYYMDISDMQVVTQIDTHFGYVSNAASATSTGFELEGNFIIDQNFSAFANFGFSEARFANFRDAGGNYAGNYNPFAPRYNYAVGLKFRGVGGLYASADVTGYGKMYLDKANEYERDAYSLVNAKVGYEWNSFDVYVYGKNIFDEEYDMVGYSGYLTMLSDPGEFGARLTWRF